jgi:hypothetical protein
MEDQREFILESRSMSGLSTVSLVVAIGAGIVAFLLVPIITGTSLGMPMQRLKYNVQATILQGDASPPRSPAN